VRILFAWTNERPGTHVASVALSYLWNQGENGICCPMGMTFASIPALRHDPALHAEWAPLINSLAYDPKAAYTKEKSGATVCMAMTEKQDGSDLRATITTARAATSSRGTGAPYLLTGHEWFFSVPMRDVFLTLAQTDKGAIPKISALSELFAANVDRKCTLPLIIRTIAHAIVVIQPYPGLRIVRRIHIGALLEG
jgi:alkylation response protein AidB-like acyl-CoA dehydrogenase